MKITDLTTVPAGKYLFIRVHTDEGITGIGEIGSWGFIDGTVGVLEKFRQYLIGQDPFRIEHHWQYMYRSMYFRGSIIMSAISAIDIALWDIKGKALGVPVYELLGGKCRDKVRSYGAVFQFTPEDMAKGCLELKEQGFTAARLMITGDVRQRTTGIQEDIYNLKVQSYVDKVAACREAVGDDFDFCLEVHRSMNPAEAVAFGRSVEQYRPLFLEDPIPPDQVDVMAQVASQVAVPIATGERAINIQEMEQIMVKKAAPQYAARRLRPGRNHPQQKGGRYGRGQLCEDRAPQSLRPGLHRRLPAAGRRHPQLRHPGVPLLLPSGDEVGNATEPLRWRTATS